MGRHKPNKSRRQRPDRSGLYRAADAYRCSDCHSATGWTEAAEPGGVGKINIHHDPGCPVLTGAISDGHDMIRTAEQIGGVAVVDASTGRAICLVVPEAPQEATEGTVDEFGGQMASQYPDGPGGPADGHSGPRGPA